MLVSIIIPVYNSKNTIERCIESVVISVEKLTTDYEIICIDDGSKDNSLEILKKLSQSNSHIIVIHQENAGAAAARNVGLETAKGEYIAFNDSDDEWLEDHFEILLDILRNNPNVSCISANHDIESQPKFSLKLLKKRNENLFEVSLFSQQFKNWFSPQNSMTLRKVIEFGVRFDSSMKGSEEFLFYNHILKDFKCYFLNKKVSQSILHKFRFGECGLSGNLKEMEKGELFALKDAYKNLGVPFLIYFLAKLFSLLKYFRRVMIVKFRKNKK